jgi:hypothetical protein
MKNLKLGKLLTLLGITALLASCEHKDLCLLHDEHSLHCGLVVQAEYDLSVEADYQGRTDDVLFPTEPEGLRMLVYTAGSDASINNLPVHGGKVSMTTGNHSLLFYNNDTEYILFNDLTSDINATATTRTRSRAAYAGNRYVSRAQSTVNPPDMLFGAYISDYTGVLAMTNDTINVTMHPLVYSYITYFNISSGMSSVAYARGALAGMAGSVYINSGITTDEQVTVLYDCDVKADQNQIEGIVKSFGIPAYPATGYSRGQYTYAVQLELRLINGETVTYDYDVTDQVESQPHGGVIIVEDIEIPIVERTGSAAPFDVDVTDWGEFQEIPIVM